MLSYLFVCMTCIFSFLFWQRPLKCNFSHSGTWTTNLRANSKFSNTMRYPLVAEKYSKVRLFWVQMKCKITKSKTQTNCQLNFNLPLPSSLIELNFKGRGEVEFQNLPRNSSSALRGGLVLSYWRANSFQYGTSVLMEGNQRSHRKNLLTLHRKILDPRFLTDDWATKVFQLQPKSSLAKRKS